MASTPFKRSSSVRLASKSSPRDRCEPTAILFSGWLKKQGSTFRTWKRRFFVLQAGLLGYYADSDRIRLLGSFEIGQFVEVSACESDFTPDDKAFAFVVKRTKILAPDQKERLLLSASTAKERKDWLRAFWKQLYLKKGGALFGTHLSEVFVYTSPEMKYVPRVVFESAEFIRQHGLTTDGIFRKCSTRHLVDDLGDAYDTAQPGPILQAEEHDAHAAAGLMKQYLRELPEPVIPYRLYDRLKATGFLIDDGQDLKPIVDQLACLPIPNYNLLQFICQLLFEVAAHSHENRMTVENLASVFAPNILRHIDDDPDIEMSATPIISVTVAGFIRRHEALFRCELLPFAAQLQSFAALATSSTASPSPYEGIITPTTRENLSEPPDSGSSFAGNAIRKISASCRRNNAACSLGSVNSALNSQPHSQIWFPHERRKSLGPSPQHQSSIETSPPSRWVNGRRSSTSGGGPPSHANYTASATEPASPGKNISSSFRLSVPLPPTFSSGGVVASDLPSPPSQSLEEQVRHWRSVALVARAEAACERAKSQALSAQLTRASIDLKLADTELGLLRKKLSLLVVGSAGCAGSQGHSSAKTPPTPCRPPRPLRTEPNP